MSERRLNINAPLMSVRRNSATSPSLTESKRKILEKRNTLAGYKSEMALDQVTEPVAVPFNWEHIPGRCKSTNTGSEVLQIPPKNPKIGPIPRLPPGKSIKSGNQKDSVVEKNFTSSNKSKSFSGNFVKLDCDREREAEKRIESRRSYVKEKEKEDNDDDNAYSDAVETLSHLTESFSVNCSVSGVSGLDHDNLDSKRFGTFSTDQQTRDFMMNRFLPAAKAMTLQPSQYSSKKQSVLVEQQPRDVNKLIQNAKKPLVTDIVPYTGIHQEEESEDEDVDEGDVYDNDNSDNVLGKGCGLIPHLQLRNSLSMLNPVSGMKMKNQVSLPPSACEVVKPNKRSHIRSFSPIPAVKKAWEAIHRNKSSAGTATSPDMQERKKRWSSESNRFAYSGELLPGRLSPFRRSRASAAGISPSRTKPQSPFRGTKLPGNSKEIENNISGNLKFHSTGLGKFQGVPTQGAKRGSYSGSLAIEKTLYIDNSSTVKLSSSKLSSVDNKRRIDTMIADFDKRREKERNSSVEISQDTKHVQSLDLEEKVTLDYEVLSSLGGNSTTLSGMLHHIAKEYEAEVVTPDTYINHERVLVQPVRGTFDEDSDTNSNKQIVLASSPLPPPLPKSPSESWLWRALPINSLKNSFMHSNQGTKSHAKRNDSNAASSNVKWETIVKTSNLHHDHIRYSQELPSRKSHHSKS
ncbi:uncharacterized protein LOC127080785 [Lathyrus oleraceus]|uniref:Uncharacterized protein n=1 Tax=Pisum sativum TaxID=3888 RepID=A0A9D5H0E2_PEA|nr:uncharacterized protein LOC127080785 [Pisum sativum]XP_050877046.1 uncharacterized protein LOC127080785 [Pisum sativum]KAI5447751.1 hypothetical protein KIW84_015266 [Pisum sativum]